MSLLGIVDLAAHHETAAEGSCPFHKLELHEIGELPATKML